MADNFNFGSQVMLTQFVNREAEQKRLENNFLTGINTTILAARRMGKSSLLAQMHHRMRKHKHVRFCYIDMFSIRDEKEFYEVFSAQLLTCTTSKWEEAQAMTKKFFNTLIPKLSLTVAEVTSLELSFDKKEIKKHSGEILDLSERIAKDKKLRIVVCLDEFQNITYFDKDISFQKRLRSFWQKHQHVTYCMYGSKRHMMAEIVQNAEMPFYRFGDIMMLGKIEEKYWLPYIIKTFASNKKKISEAFAKEIVQRMEQSPYYIQQYAQEVLNETSRSVNTETLDVALHNIINRNTIFYTNDIDGLTNNQINYLKALISGVTQFTSAHTLREFDLGGASNIKRARESLRNKNIIDDFEPGKIDVLDPVFKIWFAKQFLSKHQYN
ncbi:MAG: AAA family ATPase [Flavobacteriales bacterium]